VVLLIAGCRASPDTAGRAPESRSAPRPIRFTDVTRAAGITFRHTNGRSGRLYFPETVGSGCAFLDFDNDGRLDIYLVNGAALPGFAGVATATGRRALDGAKVRAVQRRPPTGPFYPALYRNRGDGTFADVTRDAGLAFESYGMGVAVGDYDNDGWDDLYLSSLHGGRLFRNTARPGGGRRFADVTEAAGLRTTGWGTSCAWVDVDQDGWLDLFVCHYAVWTPALNRVCPDRFGRRHMCGPRHFRGEPSRLFRNLGRPRAGAPPAFRDITRDSGVYRAGGKGLGVAVWDYDANGRPDLFVANDSEPNLLFRNDGGGKFTDVGVETGVAFSAMGQARAGMGTDTGDDQNAGQESLLIGNFDGESHALYRLSPGAATDARFFRDAASEAGLASVSLPYSTFGVLFCDLDLDGWKDIVAANGHVDEHVALGGKGVTFEEPLLIYQNDGSGRYREVGRQAGPTFAVPRLHRGIAAGDYDADGDPDLLVSVCGGAPLLLRNETLGVVDPSPRPPPRNGEGESRRTTPSSPLSASGRGVVTPADEGRREQGAEGSTQPHWLQIHPIGAHSNRSGIGTRITVVAGGLRQTGWVRSGSSYCSASDLKAFFGLGAASVAESVKVTWPSGRVDRFQNVRADQVLRVEEGTAPRS
jgi:hypothetical protein